MRSVLHPPGVSAQAADEKRRQYAMEDAVDIVLCDMFINLAEEPRGDGRGGRHVEFGYALALGKELINIGPRETVFHHLDNVQSFDDIPSFTAYFINTYSTGDSNA